MNINNPKLPNWFINSIVAGLITHFFLRACPPFYFMPKILRKFINNFHVENKSNKFFSKLYHELDKLDNVDLIEAWIIKFPNGYFRYKLEELKENKQNQQAIKSKPADITASCLTCVGRSLSCKGCEKGTCISYKLWKR